jgi:hypothetical protein
MHGHEREICPTLGEGKDPKCAWAGRLALALDAHGGRFSQTFEMVAAEPVTLPGGADAWPLDVKVDGKPAATTEDDDGVPAVRLAPGTHAVAGTFVWKRLPESLAVPAETALIALTLNGHAVDFPSRSDAGELFLQKEEAETREEDRLDISVHRRLTDEIPMLLTTRLTLNVAGKAREVLLGRSLPAGFVAQALDAPLPVRIESDGRLRVQLRPGQWVVTLTARQNAPAARVARPEPGGPWKEGEEVWVFDARPDLRVVTVEGVPGIDPQQTTLPDDWKALPAYVMGIGATITLAERRRGDADPPPDQLTLARAMWLDFDGRGLTARDQIGGVFNRQGRLAMTAESKLGRVSVAGRDQFITRLDGPWGGEGVEIREAGARIVAESRIARAGATIPAVGWDHDFQSVSATLSLPPGWRLFHASGADSVSDTWLKSWTLLDLFLLLIVGIGIGKLFGARTGALALGTLVLLIPEPDAPRWTWLAVLVAEAFVRALPKGAIRRLAMLVRFGTWVALAFVAIPFAIAEVRVGLHPSLEPRPFAAVSGEAIDLYVGGGAKVASAPAAADVGIAGLAEAEDKPREAESLKSINEVRGALGARKKGGASIDNNNNNLASYDPNAIVQTGPGVPTWSAAPVLLGWNGPVERTQRLSLWLLPPWLNLVLAFARVGLGAALIVILLGGRRRIAERWRLAGGVAVLVALAGALAVRPAAAAEGGAATAGPFPPADLMNELRERVVEAPACAPNCASAGRLALEAAPDRLRLRLDVAAEAPTTVPLPGNARHWLPSQVLLDGKPAGALVRDDAGALWLRVPAGGHQVVLEGALPPRDAVQIAFPLRPHAVTTSARGWRVEGLTEDGQIEDNLQLARVERAAAGAGAEGRGGGLAATSLPPFVTIDRRLELGLKWVVRTRVARATPTGAAVVLEVPLLPGESVITEGIHVVNRKVQMNLGVDETVLEWSSTLTQTPSIALDAAAGAPWAETWVVAAGPIWHTSFEGIPPIQLFPEPTFRPWPGEKVTVTVSRPGGSAGQSLTVDGTSLQLRPGIRSIAATLTVSLRSSRGGQHAVRLPEGASLDAVTVDGVAQPLRLEGGVVSFPIHPGAETLSLTWRQSPGLSLFFRAPEIDLGLPGVNAAVEVEMPADRWILSVGGPRIGPAVLFWSVLAVLVLVGLGLGRSPLTPLRGRHWILLGVGLSQTSIEAAAVVAGCLFAFGWRRARPAARPLAHDLGQLALGVWTVAAAVVLFHGIEQGLLAQPDMRIAGGGSTDRVLRWFADRTDGPLARPWIVSAPLLAYRVAMLAWSLWLSLALIRWARWIWASFGVGGFWRPIEWRRRETPAAPPPPDEPPPGAAPAGA